MAVNININDPAVVDRTALWLAAHFGTDQITGDIMPNPEATKKAWEREAVFMLRAAAGHAIWQDT